MQIEWGLLRPADVAGETARGFATGQGQRKERDQQNVLAALAQDPTNAGAQNALMSINPELALGWQRNVLAQREVGIKEATAKREAMGRQVGASYLRQRDGSPRTTAPVAQTAAALSEPVTGQPVVPGAAPAAAPADPNEIVVTANTAPKLSIADVYEYDPEMAKGLVDTVGKLDENGRKIFEQRVDAMGAVAQSLSRMPQEQRQAAIDTVRPALKEAGFTDQEIDGADLSDAGLTNYAAMSIGAKDILGSETTRRGQDISARGQDVSAATARRGQDMSASTARRGQDMSFAAAQMRGGGRKTEADLRKEFEGRAEIKDFKQVRDSLGQVRSIVRKARPTAQDDIALVFSYMKMLDPGSVVREGEFASAARAAGVPDRIANIAERVDTGKFLTPDQRRAMLRSAIDVYKPRRETYNNVAGQFRGYASDYGASADNVARRYKDDDRRSQFKVRR